jgi:hypothetical protein
VRTPGRAHREPAGQATLRDRCIKAHAAMAKALARRQNG